MKFCCGTWCWLTIELAIGTNGGVDGFDLDRQVLRERKGDGNQEAGEPKRYPGTEMIDQHTCYEGERHPRHAAEGVLDPHEETALRFRHRLREQAGDAGKEERRSQRHQRKTDCKQD